MALFSDLVAAVAEIEGLDVMTVTGIGQYARDSGYISKGGRGRAAAAMTPRDAANLLIAVNASGKAKDTAATVEDFYQLKVFELPYHAGTISAGEPFNSIGAIGCIFPDALEKLIESAITLDEWEAPLWLTMRRHADWDLIPGHKGGIPTSEEWEEVTRNSVVVEVEFFRPLPRAEIRLISMENAVRSELERYSGQYKIDFACEYAFPADDLKEHHQSSDRRVSTTISQATIFKVAEVLKT